MMNSLQELSWFLGSSAKEEDFNVALVVVGHPHLLPVVVVQIRESESTDSALFVLDQTPSVLELLSVASWVGDGNTMVTITGDEDVGALGAFGSLVRPDGVGESGCHVRDGQTEGIFKLSRDWVLLIRAVDEVVGDGVGPDSVGCLVGLVVVHNELFSSISVQISQLSAVSIESSVINNTAIDKGSIGERNSVDTEKLVEELSGKDDDFAGILIKVVSLNADIRTRGNDVLSPLRSAVQTFSWVLEPDQLTLTGRRVALSREEVLPAVSIEIQPESHVVIVTISVVSHGHSLHSFCDVRGIHDHKVDASVSLSGWDEAIGYDNDALVEDILRDCFGEVWPREIWGVELDRGQRREVLGNNGLLDVWDHVQMAGAEGAEGGC